MRRRTLLRVLAAAPSALSGTLSWGEIGSVAFVSAGRKSDGRYVFAGLNAIGEIQFEHLLPARGHAAALHPTRAEIAVFARRPGWFLEIRDCHSGAVIAEKKAPDSRHFYGHGTYSVDGKTLFTTENAFESGDGRIGIWDASDAYRRLGEVASGGIGPHDVALTPDGRTLAVANGGIRTHPSTGREKLNLETMRPNLSLVDLRDGAVKQSVEPPEPLRLNSIRHLSISKAGEIAVACQWQGDPYEGPPLIALLRLGSAQLEFCETGPETPILTEGYAGSIAFVSDDEAVAVSCPRADRLLLYGRHDLALWQTWRQADVCGLARSKDGLVATDGGGGFTKLEIGHHRSTRTRSVNQRISWDNHLYPLATLG